LANFNRDNRALPIAPVPTKPIFSILASPYSRLDSPVVVSTRVNSVCYFLSGGNARLRK
jgi:hypothetical protein